LQDRQFQQWRHSDHSSILWIKGDPGKGKTMLLCGIVDELERSDTKVPILSYFLCQATDRRLDNATAVLRGLIFMFVQQQPFLVSHIQAEYEIAGKSLFEGPNAWCALVKILQSMFDDKRLDGAYVVVDALDECSTGQRKLLNFILITSSTYPRIHWLVSSRNWAQIENVLSGSTQAIELSLELNEDTISAAVKTYISIKVQELTRQNKYNEDERQDVKSFLESNAQDTFLWAALIFRELLEVDGWEVKGVLEKMPSGLGPLYARMMQHISSSGRARLCKEVLAVASVALRPLTLEEMSACVTGGPPILSHPKAWEDIVKSCGSFLTLRDNVIQFVHQSAKDFLVGHATHEIYPSGVERSHYDIFERSLNTLMNTLDRDMYSLEDPAFSMEDLNSTPFPDPLATARYSCVYWVEHLVKSNTLSNSTALQIGGIVGRFLRTYYLYWLEASSLIRSMPEAQVSISRLETLLRNEVRPQFLSNG
jgi:hypothetical protein